MTQRIFDIENEKDYADLWDILPEKTDKITLEDSRCFLYDKDGFCIADISGIIKINWHDKTEITRPVEYEKMIGCVGFFWDDYANTHNVGVLTEYHRENHSPFVRNSNSSYLNFRPAKKSELKFWGED